MSLKKTRYPGVADKTVARIESTIEQQFVYVHVYFTDKTLVSLAPTSDIVLYHAALYDDAGGDQNVLRDYVMPARMRRREQP